MQNSLLSVYVSVRMVSDAMNGCLCLTVVPGFVRLPSARQLTVQMMQNPQILAALQERLDGLVGSPSGYMER